MEKSAVMAAVSPSMMEAEQYFVYDNSTARATASGLSLCPVTR